MIMQVINHHIKYKEIHGVDEVVKMDKSKHSKLHRRLRREGKCNVSPRVLSRISSTACNRRKDQATLKIDKSTLERLKFISVNMDDTYDAIICRLINHRNDAADLQKEIDRLKKETHS